MESDVQLALVGDEPSTRGIALKLKDSLALAGACERQLHRAVYSRDPFTHREPRSPAAHKHSHHFTSLNSLCGLRSLNLC